MYAMNFKDDFKVTVIRKIDIEQILLFKNAGTVKNVKRRQSLATDVRPVLKKISSLEHRRKSVSGRLNSTFGHDSPPYMAPTSPTSPTTSTLADPTLVASNSTPKTTRKIPDLVPLKSLLKQPKKAPFNIRRKSIDAAMISSSESHAPSQLAMVSSSASHAPSQLAKRTATQIIMSRIDKQANVSDWKRLSYIDQTLLQDPDFGRLHYSSSSDSD